MHVFDTHRILMGTIRKEPFVVVIFWILCCPVLYIPRMLGRWLAALNCSFGEKPSAELKVWFEEVSPGWSNTIGVSTASDIQVFTAPQKMTKPLEGWLHDELADGNLIPTLNYNEFNIEPSTWRKSPWELSRAWFLLVVLIGEKWCQILGFLRYIYGISQKKHQCRLVGKKVYDFSWLRSLHSHHHDHCLPGGCRAN